MSYADVLGVEPDGILHPSGIDEALAYVQAAIEGEKSLIPWGGGSAQDYGHLPTSAAGVLETVGLDKIIAVEPGDLTIRAESGVTLARIQDALRPHGQFLPLDAPDPSRATMGGLIATDATGPLRLGYGGVRDWLIGIHVIDGQGRLVKGGGNVVKNVTGYDIPKLHVGALGTLGLIVEATFKTCPLPETVRTVVIRLGDGELSPLVSELLTQTSPVGAPLHEDSEGRFLALVYHGVRESVEGATDRAVEIARSAGHEVSVYGEDMTAPPPPAPVVVALTGLPASAARLHEAVCKIAGAEATVETQLGVGETRIAWAEETPQVRSCIAELFVTAEVSKLRATLLHGSCSLRAGLPAIWFPLPPALPLMKSLKGVLDPRATFNPGRFVGGI